jgi:hypothetical protein
MKLKHHPNPVVALARRRSYSLSAAARFGLLALPTMNNFG